MLALAAWSLCQQFLLYTSVYRVRLPGPHRRARRGLVRRVRERRRAAEPRRPCGPREKHGERVYEEISLALYRVKKTLFNTSTVNSQIVNNQN